MKKRVYDLLKIVNDTFNLKPAIQYLNDSRCILSGSNLFLDISIEENCLCIESIILPETLRGKGFTYKFIDNLSTYIKKDNYLSIIKVSAVCSSSLCNICKKLNFNHEEYSFPDFDYEEFDDFDGFYGNFYKNLA